MYCIFIQDIHLRCSSSNTILKQTTAIKHNNNSNNTVKESEGETVNSVWSEPGLTHGVCIEFIWLGNTVIFSVKKSGGEKWRGYLCLTEVKRFSPRPAASLLTTRQPSPPANTHLVRSPLHTSCHSTEALTRPPLLKHLKSNVKSFQVSRCSSVFFCFCARGEAELRGRAQRQVHQVQGQLFFFLPLFHLCN